MFIPTFTGRIGNVPAQYLRQNQDGSAWLPMTVIESTVGWNPQDLEYIQRAYWSITTTLPAGYTDADIPLKGDEVLLIGITVTQEKKPDDNKSHTKFHADYMRVTKRSAKNAEQQRQQAVQNDPWTAGPSRNDDPPF